MDMKRRKLTFNPLHNIQNALFCASAHVLLLVFVLCYFLMVWTTSSSITNVSDYTVSDPVCKFGGNALLAPWNYVAIAMAVVAIALAGAASWLLFKRKQTRQFLFFLPSGSMFAIIALEQGFLTSQSLNLLSSCITVTALGNYNPNKMHVFDSPTQIRLLQLRPVFSYTLTSYHRNCRSRNPHAHNDVQDPSHFSRANSVLIIFPISSSLS